MKNAHWTVLILFFPFVLWAGVDSPDSSAIQLKTFQTHSRISFRIDESVPAEWKNTQQGFELILKGLGLADLGAPLGEEENWSTQFEKLSDSRLDHLQIREIPGGVQITGKWKFPRGSLTLANPIMEYFDFHEKEPLRYVVDFWLKAGPTVLEAKRIRRKKEILAEIAKTQIEEKRRIDRKIASIKRHKEAESATSIRKYCEEPLSEKNDVFLPFNPLHPSIDFSKWIPGITADSDFSYFKPRKRNREAQYVRLALEFYSQGKLGLAIRTLAFFDQEFPLSDFQTEMKFLKANSMLRLGFDTEPERALAKLVEEARDSPVAMFSAMYLARKNMDRNLYLAAMDQFLWLVRHYPDYSLNWVFHLGIAECLYALKQTERAAKEYRWIMENGPDATIQAEGAARMGDIYLAHYEYAQASGAYSQSASYYKEQLKKYPPFYLNWGEALYQLGAYDQAKQIFTDFLQSSTSYPEAWRATFRLGEIEARQAKQGMSAETARKWFYESINNYPLSIGASLARIRLLPCGDHGGFNQQAQERFFSEDARLLATNPDAAKSVVLKNYEDFRALSRIRALVAWDDKDQTANVAIHEIQIVKTPLVKRTLAAVANEYFRKSVLGLLEKDKKFEALSFYRANAPLMPPLEDASQADFLLQLARVAGDYHLGGFAQELTKTYESASAENTASVEHMRSPSSLSEDTETQIKNSEAKFTVARAQWIVAKETKPENFNNIRELLNEVVDESKFSYEKEIILGLLEEKEGNLRAAIGHASRAMLLNNSPRIYAWLASLQFRAGELNASLELYEKVHKRNESGKPVNSSFVKNEDILGVPPLPVLDAVLLTEAEILEKEGRWGEAAEKYSKIIEEGKSGSQLNYLYANSLIKQGGAKERVKALSILEKLTKIKSKEDNDEFWKKLAFQTLENIPRRGKDE